MLPEPDYELRYEDRWASSVALMDEIADEESGAELAETVDASTGEPS